MILLKGKEGIFHVIGKDIQNVFQNLFKQRYKWRREIKRYVASSYTADAPHAAPPGKEVIFMVDGKMHHGGLADRLRGIVSVYSICKKMGIPFKLHFVSPFSLEEFLVPNKVDWHIEDSEISYNSEDSLAIFCGSNGTHVEKPFQRRWFVKNFKKNVKQIHVYTNAILLQGEDFQRHFNELFKMTPALEASIKEAKEGIGEKYISVSSRFQQLLGDFEEENCEILNAEQRDLLMQAAAAEIDKIYNSQTEKLPILLTSDSMNFVAYMKEKAPYIRTIKGNIAHMDYSQGSALDVHLKTFTDLLTLSGSQKLYLLKSPKMYNSGFPRMASMIGNKPFQLVRFMY